MLQDLVRVGDVEGVVGVRQRVDVADLEGDPVDLPLLGQGPGRGDGLLGAVDAGHPAVAQPLREIDGDGAGPRPDVEQPVLGPQTGEEIAR